MEFCRDTEVLFVFVAKLIRAKPGLVLFETPIIYSSGDLDRFIQFPPRHLHNEHSRVRENATIYSNNEEEYAYILIWFLLCSI